jgi:peptide/nickel transport system substrate-binding protein
MTAARLVGVLGIAAWVAGCGQTQRTGDQELVILIEASVEDLDPRFAASGYAIKISRLVAAPLVSLNTRNMHPKMELAQSVVQPNPHTYVVTLRPKARFSDGAPVTAADVKATLDSIRASKSLSPYRRAFARIVSIDVLGKRKVRFVLRGPHAPFLGDLDMGILKASQVKGAAVRAGGRIPDGQMVGAGPLRIVRRTSQRIVLAPNPHFHGAKPKLKRYVVKTVEDDNSRLLCLVSGGGDITQNTVAPLLLPALKRSDKLRVQSGPSLMTTYLAFNLRDKHLRDRRVRLAIAHALDRRRIVRAKFRGRAVLATSILTPHHWAHNKALSPIPFDLAAARRLLDAAGLKRPAGGGPRLKLSFKTSSNRFRLALARVLARQLGRVGIEVKVRSYEWGVFFADLKKGSFQLATLQMTELAEPDYHYYFFHSSKRTSVASPNAGGNRFGYADAEVDGLLERGRAELDRGRRRQIYRRVQARLARDLPILPLWHEDNLVVMRRHVRGYQMLPNARFDPMLGIVKRP